jgi:hypothetical protein
MDNYWISYFAMGRLLMFWLLISLPLGAIGDTFHERRAQVGLKLFRTFVSANQNIDQYLDAKGQLLIGVLHASTNRATAERYQKVLLATMPAIRQHPSRIETLSLTALLQHQGSPAAIFVSDKLSADERSQLVDFSIRHRLAVFSPFEGDVESGILGGLSVEAKVRPLVNIKTLNASGIPLKNFYLSVSRRYEKQ